MTGKHEQSPEHKKAHDLAEEAIDKAAQGDTADAKKMVEEAKKLDPKIAEEMGREVESDRRKAEAFRDKDTSER